MSTGVFDFESCLSFYSSTCYAVRRMILSDRLRNTKGANACCVTARNTTTTVSILRVLHLHSDMYALPSLINGTVVRGLWCSELASLQRRSSRMIFISCFRNEFLRRPDLSHPFARDSNRAAPMCIIRI